MKDIILKIGMDYGSLKLMLQIMTKNYIKKCIKTKRPLNTTDSCFIIGISKAKETYRSTLIMYQLSHVEKLFKLAIDKK